MAQFQIKWRETKIRQLSLPAGDLAAQMGVPHSWIDKVEQMERRLDVLARTVSDTAQDACPAQ